MLPFAAYLQRVKKDDPADSDQSDRIKELLQQVYGERGMSVSWGIVLRRGMELLFLGTGSYLDVKDRELPVGLFVFFGILGLVVHMILRDRSVNSILAGLIPGAGCVLVSWLTREMLGYGDSMGLCVLGIFEDLENVFWIMFIAFMLSAVYGLWEMLVRRQGLKAAMPFFPFLWMALVGVIIW